MVLHFGFRGLFEGMDIVDQSVSANFLPILAVENSETLTGIPSPKGYTLQYVYQINNPFCF